MIASHLVVTVITFILKIIETKAACYWNGVDSCLIYCTNMNAASIHAPIENLYAEREHCHDKFTLRLRTLTYPNDTIGSFWFTADVTVSELEVYFNDVKNLSADALNADSFRTVKKLTFETFTLPLIVNGTFNGLDVLEIINIKGAQGVSRIETGVLDSLTELQEFTFEPTGFKSGELNINGFTGSAVLSKLEYVKIRYNLANSIKKFTFIGLKNVKRLDLSSSYISFIEDNSFDPISETIEELDLSGNALTTIAYGVFSMVLPNIKTININGNKWDCVCDLMAFRSFIEKYKDNFDGINCVTPTECSISNILESDCFATCDIPTTTTPDTTTTPTTTTSPPNANLMIECPNDLLISNTVSIERPIGYMTISKNEYGEANLSIDTEQNANLVVIRFDEEENSSEIEDGNGINCISLSDVSSIPITDLKNDVVYSYCLMRKTSTSVSPLDCISYVKRQDQMSPVWLPESSKILTISLVVVSLLLSIFLGIGILIGLMRHNPFSKHNNQQSKMVKESTDALRYGVDRNTTSNIYIRNTIQADTFGQDDAIKCPPLPERPPKVYEEPVYASVEEE
ncbi:hypothetical protein HA402_013007 [Bradysia odoriphaga]|nr:hypothetical protein HA402_013007 [Bradysia odoriphaga]